MDEVAAIWVDVGVLVPWRDNPRKNDEAVPMVAESIKRFGFGAPIVARRDDNMIIAGHTRFRAAKSIGLTSVPVRFLDVTIEEATALALADNKLGEISSWDDDKLSDIIDSIEDLSLVDVAGFSEDLGEKSIKVDDHSDPVKEWDVSGIEAMEQIVLIVDAQFSKKHELMELVSSGGYRLNKCFLTYSGAIDENP